MSDKRIKSALISVFYKDGLDEIVRLLHSLDIKIYSTGGTFSFINDLGIPAGKVEDLTTYPSILGGRVKTLHPNVFGGILARREVREDIEQLSKYSIPEIDLVIVGSDRTLGRTGEVANKIGTYTKAVLAHRHGIPFYVAIPLSTIDWDMRSGFDIPIEDFLFGWAMVTAVLLLWERQRDQKKHGKKAS